MKNDFIRDMFCTIAMSGGVALATHSFPLFIATLGFAAYLSNIRADLIK
jgi:hypothetical protein